MTEKRFAKRFLGQSMATIKDIAKTLNISTSTVSYALNGGPRPVPESVRRKVLDLARELDYRPNRVARSLVTRSSGAIGVVPPSVERDVFLSPFVRFVWNAIVNEAEAQGQDLLLFAGHNRNTPEETGIDLLDGRIDGAVFIAPVANLGTLNFLHDRNFPFTGIAGLDNVGVQFTADNEAGVHSAVEHLVSMGHKRIAHIAGSSSSVDGPLRQQVFIKSMQRFGLEVPDEYIQDGNFTILAGHAAARRLLRLCNPPTAIFAANDEMAFGACTALQQAGLRVPEDVSIVGFDDCDLSISFYPPLTTVRQPVSEMAAAALRSVVRMARDNGVAESASFPTKLVVRRSTGPVGGTL